MTNEINLESSRIEHHKRCQNIAVTICISKKKYLFYTESFTIEVTFLKLKNQNVLKTKFLRFHHLGANV